MNLVASDIYSLFRPSKCERRVFLRAHDEPEADASEFDKLIEELGRRHETNHLARFPKVLDLSGGSLPSRADRTLRAIEANVEVIYQGVFQASLPATGDSILGIPDFLVNGAAGYSIRDCKLSRHAGEGRHEEIVLQLQLYGWLYEQNLGKPPASLEVYLGDESTVELPYDGGTAALESLGRIARLSQLSEEPYSPVGWSKCSGCGFRDRCWKLAEQMHDVALVYELDQGTAIALKEQGVTTVKGLIDRFDKDALAELKKPRGTKMVRVGTLAERILQQAEALHSGKETLLHPLQLPEADNMVMFDLEGLPPQFDELDKVYLWGTQVYGTRPGNFIAALADFGPEGDRIGWEQFLKNSRMIFDAYGDIPFIHWHHYETTKLKSYIERYGDPDVIARRVLDNCVDLLRITRDALVLPEYSYSLKVIEKRAGFKRTMTDFGGDWSIVQYIRAVETNDENLRNEIMSQILKYNEEDLKATWAVLLWLRTKGST
jgi:predicted RecB family nuclease